MKVDARVYEQLRAFRLAEHQQRRTRPQFDPNGESRARRNRRRTIAATRRAAR